MKVNENFMRSLGIEMSASISKRTTAENRRRRRTRAGVDREGTATVERTIRTPSAEPRDAENACLLGKEGRSIHGSGKDGNKKTGGFIAETAKGYIRAPFVTRKRPVPRGNTAPARSIGWNPALAPFPTRERGHDSQRDRLNQPRGFSLASEAGALPTWTP